MVGCTTGIDRVVPDNSWVDSDAATKPTIRESTNAKVYASRMKSVHTKRATQHRVKNAALRSINGVIAANSMIKRRRHSILNIVNTKKSKLSIRKLERRIFMVAMFGWFLAAVTAELCWRNENQPSLPIDILKSVTSASTLLLMVLVVIKYLSFLTRDKQLHVLPPETKLVYTPRFRFMMMELLICVLHSPPFLPKLEYTVRHLTATIHINA